MSDEIEIPQFVVKEGRGVKARYSLANIKAANYPAIRVNDGAPYSVGGMTFQAKKDTGKYDHSRVIVSFDRAARSVVIALRRPVIHKTLRLVRTDERIEIERIDAQIMSLRAQRAEVVARAWDKGHSVTIEALTKLADHQEDIRKEKEQLRMEAVRQAEQQ